LLRFARNDAALLSRKGAIRRQNSVIPAKAGIQSFQNIKLQNLFIGKNA
jgi:hypothetical protein